MKRGTTVTHVFNTTEDMTRSKIYVTYSQKGRVVLEKTNNNIVIEAGKITVPLSQEDTLNMLADVPTEIQIRLVREDGTAIASNIVHAKVSKILKGGVISYG